MIIDKIKEIYESAILHGFSFSGYTEHDGLCFTNGYMDRALYKIKRPGGDSITPISYQGELYPDIPVATLKELSFQKKANCYLTIDPIVKHLADEIIKPSNVFISIEGDMSATLQELAPPDNIFLDLNVYIIKGYSMDKRLKNIEILNELVDKILGA